MIVENLVEYLKQKAEEENINSNIFHISNSNKCTRALYYQFFNYPKEELPDRAYLVFDDGEMQHKHLRTILWNSGIRIVKREEPVSIIVDGQQIEGKIDGIVTIDKEKYVVEIKTANRFHRIPDDIVTNYEGQIYLYMDATEIPQLLLLIKNKDNSMLYEHIIKYDEKIVTKYIQKWQKLIEAIKTSNIPDREYNIFSDWQCSYCLYKTECKKDLEIKEIKDNETMVINDDEINTMIKVYKEIEKERKEKEKEYEMIKDEIMNIFNQYNVAKFKTKDYQVILEKYTRKTYNIPEDVKKSYTIISECSRLKIINL